MQQEVLPPVGQACLSSNKGTIVNSYGNRYTKAERDKMLDDMAKLSSMFYAGAAQCGVHAFIEFAGLMNEFIKVCHDAEDKGMVDWPMANTHCGTALPFKPYHVDYLNEKLECIFQGLAFASTTKPGKGKS